MDSAYLRQYLNKTGRVKCLRLRCEWKDRRPLDKAYRMRRVGLVTKRGWRPRAVEVITGREDSEMPMESSEIMKPMVWIPNPLELWSTLPSRYRLLFATGLSYVICNMDKVNMSVAIIPMAKQFGWSATVSGIVQSGFFYGYMLGQLPGGFLNTTFSGARMLPIGVFLWSAATAAVPFVGSSIVGLCASRALVGLGEAIAPSALQDLVSRVVPVTERSRSMTSVGSALYLGTLIGLLLSPILVIRCGWPYVFYVFGGIGIVWTAWWVRLIQDMERTDPHIHNKLLGNDRRGRTYSEAIPWRAMLRCRALQALIYTHFCNNWFSFSILAWLPSYFKETLGLSLHRAAQLSLIPPIAGIMASWTAGQVADRLIAAGWRIGRVRKMVQCTAFLAPSLCLLVLSIPAFASRSLILITIAFGFSCCSLAGLYCNHGDLSKEYSSLLLGMTNTAGALPGVLGVAATGALLDMTGSWSLALFIPAIFFFVSGSIVFTLYGSGEPVDFSNDQQLAVEGVLRL